MQIKLWGVRGSCPKPITTAEYSDKIKKVLEFLLPIAHKNPREGIQELFSLLPQEYKTLVGGNTTCIEVRHGDWQLILDLGTGVRELGDAILSRNKSKAKASKDIHILLTHTHWDHIQGWPFFSPAYLSDYKIHFYSCIPDLKDRLMGQQQASYFPVNLKVMQSERHYHYIEPYSQFSIGPFRIDTAQLVHPGACTSYKIRSDADDSKRFVFATDTEFRPAALRQQLDRYTPHFRNADLLVMDGQYTLKDSLRRRGWGHTAMLTAVDCAIYWDVKKMLITHHEPSYSDRDVWHLFAEAKEYLKVQKKSSKLKIGLAKEGDVYHL